MKNNNQIAFQGKVNEEKTGLAKISSNKFQNPYLFQTGQQSVSH